MSYAVVIAKKLDIQESMLCLVTFCTKHSYSVKRLNENTGAFEEGAQGEVRAMARWKVELSDAML